MTHIRECRCSNVATIRDLDTVCTYRDMRTQADLYSTMWISFESYKDITYFNNHCVMHSAPIQTCNNFK